MLGEETSNKAPYGNDTDYLNLIQQSNCRRCAMGTRTMVRSISGILLIFLFFAGVIVASTGASAAAQSGIIKKIRIALPSELDTSALLWNNVPVFAMRKDISFTPTMKGVDAVFVFLKDIKPVK
jgi:hypothetical protein